MTTVDDELGSGAVRGFVEGQKQHEIRDFVRCPHTGQRALCFQLLDSPMLDDSLTTSSARAFTDTGCWYVAVAGGAGAGPEGEECL